MHIVCEPPTLYLGTPVVLISTVNEDGTYNLAPMSSAFWLGWRCILGLATLSKTPQNMIRTGQCVLNLPSENMVSAVNRLAQTTGTDPVPAGKVARGYRYEKQKFEISRLTPVKSQTVAAPRVKECPVQLEAVVEHVKDLAENDEKVRGRSKIFEVRVQRVHVAEEILMDGHTDRIDPDKWRPLIMSFVRFYGLTPNQVHESTLGQVPEALYRSPDVDRARLVVAAAAD
jgi:flavin reductase (DIM6/NTAB) family NADH-FMN oxidoreductase RutF